MDQPESVAIEALDVAQQARTLQVVDAASYRAGSELLLGIKALLGRISETFRPHIKRAWDAHRALIASEQAAAAPLLDAEDWLKQSLVGFNMIQESRRREEERQQQERARIDAEARRIAEAAALEIEAQATGDTQMLADAQRVLDEPDVTPTIILPSYTPKVAGVSHRETWSAEVTNLAALAAYAGGHPQALNLVQPNQAALNSLARAQRELMQVPGVRPVKASTVAARRG